MKNYNILYTRNDNIQASKMTTFTPRKMRTSYTLKIFNIQALKNKNIYII